MKTRSRPVSILALMAVALTAFPLTHAQEPANPDSKPLKDRSPKASPRSDRLEDTTRRASEDSRPVEDEKPGVADGKRVQPAGKDAKPVTDGDSKASDRARREVDQSKNANPDSTTTDDATPGKASPDARKTRDATNDKAAPDAAKVEDSNDEKASPDARETATKDRMREVQKAPAVKELPRAEADVVRAYEELARDLHPRKIQLQNREQALRLMEDILGKESALSRAELTRQDQSESRREARQDRRAAATFLRQRLRGEADSQQVPPFFRKPAPAEAVAGEPVRPEPHFLHEGRRYVFYPSRDDIPAVLFANAVLQEVKILPAAQLDAGVVGGHIPDEYRGRDVWAVSYPVVTASTITSHDILFQQGSTQFADGHSYDMVLALSDAMQNSELAGVRFAIEGHASTEGTFTDNLLLSQLRAEAIVRELVRGGIAADRLIPVGYGESEAHHPADASESLRSQDRRVVVSRIDAPANR